MKLRLPKQRTIQRVARYGPGRTRAILRHLTFTAARRVRPFVVAEADGARFLVSTRDIAVGRNLFVHGSHDGPLMRRVVDCLSREQGSRFGLAGRTFLDIGGNLGSSTVEAFRVFGAERVVAFEPDPQNFALLERNLAANGVRDRVEAHRLALSDAAGEVAFAKSEVNWGDHRVVAGGAAAAAITVPATTLDALVADGTVDLAAVGLAWIDVQGHEAHVLRGGGALLAADMPLVMEFWPHGLREAGGYDDLCAQLGGAFARFIDLGDPREREASAPRPVAELPGLLGPEPGPDEFTDLLLLRR